MRLSSMQKTDSLFEQIAEISDKSFRGVDNPPVSILRTHFDRDEVYIAHEYVLLPTTMSVAGFAIVTERGGCPYLWTIAVDPKYRNRGKAKLLLSSISNDFRQLGAQRIELTCKVDNPAQKLYFDQGWRAVRVIPRYYLEEGDGLLMRKIL